MAYSVEDEIDLIELIRPLWQQRILIATITILSAVMAVVLAFKATPQYRIFTQLKPGIYRWDSNNNPIPYLKTNDLKSIITGGIAETYITTKTEIEAKTLNIEVKSNRGSNQLTAYFFWPNPAEGKKIMVNFIDFLNDPHRKANQNKLSGLQIQRLSLKKSIQKLQEEIKTENIQKQIIQLDIDEKKENLKLVNLQSDRLKREIECINADVKMTEKRVNFLGEMIAVAEETRAGYEKNRHEIDENTNKIISLRDKLLHAPPDDSLQLLLLANTIQQNIAYLDTIEQKIETTRKEVISYNTSKAERVKEQRKYILAIADLQDDIDLKIPKQKSDIQKSIIKLQLTVEKEIPSKVVLLNQQISTLNTRINTISMIEVVEYPQASVSPTKPNKKKMVMLAAVMGFFLAIVIAYLRHFWISNREKLISE